MRKVSEDEQRRKASYSLVRTVGSGTDTLFHSGSGITRVSIVLMILVTLIGFDSRLYPFKDIYKIEI